MATTNISTDIGTDANRAAAAGQHGPDDVPAASDARSARKKQADTARATLGKVPDSSKAAAAAPSGKAQLVLKKLRAAKGATIVELMEATGWQAHSVRGFLSGTVKKKLGLNLASAIGKGEVRRYRILTNVADSEA